LNSLQAQEQQRAIREERFVEEVLLAKHEDGGRYKNNINMEGQIVFSIKENVA